MVLWIFVGALVNACHNKCWIHKHSTTEISEVKSVYNYLSLESNSILNIN